MGNPGHKNVEPHKMTADDGATDLTLISVRIPIPQRDWLDSLTDSRSVAIRKAIDLYKKHCNSA